MIVHKLFTSLRPCALLCVVWSMAPHLTAQKQGLPKTDAAKKEDICLVPGRQKSVVTDAAPESIPH